MDSKQKAKSPVPIQADADHEVVTTPLFKLYQTNRARRGHAPPTSRCYKRSGRPRSDGFNEISSIESPLSIPNAAKFTQKKVEPVHKGPRVRQGRTGLDSEACLEQEKRYTWVLCHSGMTAGRKARANAYGPSGRSATRDPFGRPFSVAAIASSRLSKARARCNGNTCRRPARSRDARASRRYLQYCRGPTRKRR
jgi:hypothetical protein